MTNSHIPFHSGDDFFAWTIEMLQIIGGLTCAEMRVCEHLMLGRRYIDIAAMESISEETVRWHTKRILRKLDAETTREFTLVIGRALDEIESLPSTIAKNDPPLLAKK